MWVDPPPSSLMDSIMNPKMKTMEGKKVGARSLAHNTSGVKRRARALGWVLGTLTSKSTTHTDLTNQTISWLVHNYNTFGAHTNHKQTWTHKTHHSLDFGEATTFPLIVFFVVGHGANTRMSFCPGTLKLRVSKFPKLGFPRFWRPIILCAKL